MSKTACEIPAKNLLHLQSRSAASAEKSLAHIGELARALSLLIKKETGSFDILHAAFHTDTASRLFHKALSEKSEAPLFASCNAEAEPLFLRESERYTRLCLCRLLGGAHTTAELVSLVFGSLSSLPREGERKIAFLRNRQTFRAFECFAGTLGGVSVLYENNFSDALEAVESGQATFAIIPIHSSSDGKLSSFYRMIEKHELAIVYTCDIESEDGEATTTFALIYKDRVISEAGKLRFECKITMDDLSGLADIADAAYYFGASIESLEAVPMAFSGRSGTFAVVFDLENADADGLLCYLALAYPQMTAVGFYGKLERRGT